MAQVDPGRCRLLLSEAQQTSAKLKSLAPAHEEFPQAAELLAHLSQTVLRLARAAEEQGGQATIWAQRAAWIVEE